MLREFLKSKLHRAMITDSNVEYEGSIEIDQDLMDEVGIEEGEKVLVGSISKGGRLETYSQAGVRGSRRIILNGGAAHIIGEGERVAIMAFGYAEERIQPKRVVLNDENNIIIRKD